MINYLPVERLERYLRHVLSPIYRIVDDEGDVRITQGDQQLGKLERQSLFHSVDDTIPIEQLYELSIEVRDLVQNKVGTTAFSVVWEQLRKRSVEKRGSRKAEQHRMVRLSQFSSRCFGTDSARDAYRLLWIRKHMADGKNSGQL